MYGSYFTLKIVESEVPYYLRSSDFGAKKAITSNTLSSNFMKRLCRTQIYIRKKATVSNNIRATLKI
jgi:hypothetical protein